MKPFEAFTVGEVWQLGRHTFTADDIKAFARRFDPQLFHVDEAAAAKSQFGALCASGWHTAAIWMRLMVDHARREAQAMRARGETVTPLGPSPGFRNLKWIRPVYAGDTIAYATELTGKRTSASHPEFGLIFMHSTGINQNSEPVFSFDGTVFVPLRTMKT